jgi:type II secretory pathway pseudopilin PulG
MIVRLESHVRCLAIHSARSAFSIVELTIAIGIFAFVVVGVLGLFPVAIKQRSSAALETRVVLVAQQVFDGIQAANSVSNALSSDYSIKWSEAQNPSLRDLTAGLVLGFSDRGTTVNHIFEGTRAWDTGDVGPVAQSITTKALVTAVRLAPGLYDVTVKVGYPASSPADTRRSQTFNALLAAP